MNTGNKILGTYKIRYGNGMVQHCNLINQSDYETIVKPTKDRIADLLLTKDKDDKSEAKRLKDDLKAQFSDNYFTTGSPIYKAVGNGILSLPEHQGGNHSCIVTVADDIVLQENEIE